jgi:hypothetical protein
MTQMMQYINNSKLKRVHTAKFLCAFIIWHLMRGVLAVISSI